MKSTHKQTALKASLFMILAANVSWQTSKSLNLVSNQEMHSIDLAQTAPSSSELRGSTPGRTGGVSAPANIPVIRVAPAPAVAATGPRPDAPIAAATVQTKESTQTEVICSLDFKIQFIQETSAANGKPIVHAYVRQVNPDRTFDGLKQEGTYRELIGNSETKEQWLDLITESVTAKLKKEGRSCDGRDDRGPVVDRRERDEDNGDDARVERGRRNCTLDEEGDALRNSDRASCNLQRLASIQLDRMNDDERGEDRDEDRGSRRERRRDTSSEGIREVQDALEPLKTSIRSLMLSTNSKRRSDGNRLMNRVLAALSKVRNTAASSSDERAMNKIISNLDKTYTLGQRVNELAADKADKIADLDDKISDLNIRAMSSQNPYERFNLQRQATAWGEYRSNEITKLSQNSDYLKLRAYEQAGLIDQSEFADFTADFNALAQTGSMSASGVTAPNDILNGRANIGDPRSQGAGLPTYPVIDYSRLGLQNPAIIGGQQPVVPSPMGYPQTSGFPVTTGFPQNPQFQTMPYQQVPYQQVPYQQMPMTFPAGVPPQGYSNPQLQTQNGWQTTPGYYNRSVMTQPMRL